MSLKYRKQGDMMKCSLKERDVLSILFIHSCIVVAVQDMGLHMLKCVMSHGKTFVHKLEHVETLKIGTNHRCFITSIYLFVLRFSLKLLTKRGQQLQFYDIHHSNMSSHFVV